MEYESGLLIGRFQPFHLGHKHAVSYALSVASRLLLGIGSSNCSREPANPFTTDERRAMILNSLDKDILERTSIYEIPDVHNHIRWMAIIRDTLPKFDTVFTNDKITADLYRQNGTPVTGIPFLDRTFLSGTAIRAMASSGNPWKHLVPNGTADIVGSIMEDGSWPADGHGSSQNIHRTL